MEHTILVVEDEQGIREAIGIYMKKIGRASCRERV